MVVWMRMYTSYTENNTIRVGNWQIKCCMTHCVLENKKHIQLCTSWTSRVDHTVATVFSAVAVCPEHKRQHQTLETHVIVACLQQQHLIFIVKRGGQRQAVTDECAQSEHM